MTFSTDLALTRSDKEEQGSGRFVDPDTAFGQEEDNSRAEDKALTAGGLATGHDGCREPYSRRPQ
jgi:hypothetical protein